MKIVTTFNDNFAEVAPFSNLFKWSGNVTSLANNIDTIVSIVLKFHNHPKIKMIKKNLERSLNFQEKP